MKNNYLKKPPKMKTNHNIVIISNLGTLHIGAL